MTSDGQESSSRPSSSRKRTASCSSNGKAMRAGLTTFAGRRCTLPSCIGARVVPRVSIQSSELTSGAEVLDGGGGACRPDSACRPAVCVLCCARSRCAAHGRPGPARACRRRRLGRRRPFTRNDLTFDSRCFAPCNHVPHGGGIGLQHT